MNTAGIRASATALALVVIAGCASVKPDYAREKRPAGEIAPSTVVGAAVTLETGGGRKFLGILTPAAKPRAAVILVHGTGAHPDFGLIAQLRSGLADRGYTTLSIQMPVLPSDAAASEYPALFGEAGERIATSLAYLRAKGSTRVAIVSHSMGARMVNDFLARRPDTRLIAWVPVAISSGQFDSLSGIRFPILDIYAEKDLDVVLQGAASRARMLRGLKGSRQAMVYGTDHTFVKKEKEVAALIDQLLTPLAK
jgi:alpha/beta superfamily hydrolase